MFDNDIITRGAQHKMHKLFHIYTQAHTHISRTKRHAKQRSNLLPRQLIIYSKPISQRCLTF
jgi:hypothetical protein